MDKVKSDKHSTDDLLVYRTFYGSVSGAVLFWHVCYLYSQYKEHLDIKSLKMSQEMAEKVQTTMNRRPMLHVDFSYVARQRLYIGSYL